MCIEAAVSHSCVCQVCLAQTTATTYVSSQYLLQWEHHARGPEGWQWGFLAAAGVIGCSHEEEMKCSLSVEREQDIPYEQQGCLQTSGFNAHLIPYRRRLGAAQIESKGSCEASRAQKLYTRSKALTGVSRRPPRGSSWVGIRLRKPVRPAVTARGSACDSFVCVFARVAGRSPAASW